MYIRSESACQAFTANDGCRIKELIHPKHMSPADAAGIGFSLALAEVEPGGASYRHTLDQHEVYYLLEGEGMMHVDDEARRVSRGDAVSIPAGAAQWIENVGATALRFVAVVCPPWTADGDRRV